MENQNIIKIKKLSGRLKKFATLMLYLTPLAILLYWLSYNNLPEDMKYNYTHLATAHKTLPLSVRLACIAISMIPAGIFMFANKLLINLSNLYEKGIFFATENVFCFKKLGKIVISWAFIDIAVNTLLTLIMTLINPPGQRILAIGIGSFQFSSLIIGIVIVLISRVMEEAKIMNDEQQYIV